MTCSADECEREPLWRGMCRAHYERWRRSRPGVREAEAAYDRRRRSRPERQAAERERNRGRRGYINAWLRGYTRIEPSAVVETIDSRKVFERDGYRCQLCGEATKGKWPAATSATLDHIIPLSKGGEHSYRNTQCACFGCNNRKGANAANDQLRLVG